jgi:hypothetical protein
MEKQSIGIRSLIVIGAIIIGYFCRRSAQQRHTEASAGSSEGFPMPLI